VTQPYPHDERRKVRALLKRMEKTRDLADQIIKGQRPFSPDFAAGLTALTDSADPETQIKTLDALVAARHKQHLDRLVDLAPMISPPSPNA
jgi:cytochrome c556